MKNNVIGKLLKKTDARSIMNVVLKNIIVNPEIIKMNPSRIRNIPPNLLLDVNAILL